MNEKTASQVHHEQYERQLAELKRESFWKHPETLPEALAKHYCSMAMVALQLATIIRHSKYGHNPETEYLIMTLSRTIMDAHLHDLGSEIVPIRPYPTPPPNPQQVESM